MILGLTGSLGSGKTTVAQMIREFTGAFVIDADEITYQLQAPGGAAHGKIVEAFGQEFLKPDGTLDRRKLGELVFANEHKRASLNSIVHPLVRDEEVRLLEQHRADKLVVLMVPLLYEVGMETLVDKVVVVTVTEKKRSERLWLRSGLAEAEIQRRLGAQLSQDEKIRRADYVIDNSGELDETRRQVVELLRTIKADSKFDAEP